MESLNRVRFLAGWLWRLRGKAMQRDRTRAMGIIILFILTVNALPGIVIYADKLRNFALAVPPQNQEALRGFMLSLAYLLLIVASLA